MVATGSATLTDANIVGNLAVGGPGSANGPGYGGGVFVAPAATATADAKTKIHGNLASTAGNDVYGTLILTPSTSPLAVTASRQRLVKIPVGPLATSLKPLKGLSVFVG
jgi:hypothetical protein